MHGCPWRLSSLFSLSWSGNTLGVLRNSWCLCICALCKPSSWPGLFTLKLGGSLFTEQCLKALCPLGKLRGSPAELECWTSFLRLPVVADVQDCSGTLHQRCGGTAEGEVLGLGCSVTTVYDGGQGAFSPWATYHSLLLQKIALLGG